MYTLTYTLSEYAILSRLLKKEVEEWEKYLQIDILSDAERTRGQENLMLCRALLNNIGKY